MGSGIGARKALVELVSVPGKSWAAVSDVACSFQPDVSGKSKQALLTSKRPRPCMIRPNSGREEKWWWNWRRRPGKRWAFALALATLPQPEVHGKTC